MKIYADIQLVGSGIMEPHTEWRLKVVLWVNDSEGHATRLSKLGRVFHDAGLAEAAHQRALAAIQLLQIEERPQPALAGASI